MSEGKFGTGDLFIAALLGAVIGAGAALLLAPKSGKETREQLAGYIKDGTDLAKKLPDALKQASSAAKASFIEAEKKA